MENNVMIIKKLAKFSDYLESKGLKKEADALMNMLEEDRQPLALRKNSHNSHHLSVLRV